ncbi:hypothetical protein BGW38_007334, partial [Lunasporangiospora selenospora]
EAAAPAEPEPAVKTLDDYLQEKASKSLKVSLPEARTANSGTDNTQWKNTEVLEIVQVEDFINFGKESIAKTRKGKKETKVLITDIEVRYTEPAREPVPARRGGRGSDRPRGARGGNNASAPRRGAARGTPVNVDDTNLFPSLGSK